MSSIFTKLKKFLGKHADELAGVTSVLDTVVGALPIDPQDKRKVRAVLDKLNSASESIAASADAMKDENITFTDAQVGKALKDFLSTKAGKTIIVDFMKAETKASFAAAKPVKFGE